MINKLRILLCVALCAVVFGAVNQTSAQTADSDKILVAGKQPLRQSHVDKMIEFYEWAFETNFSADERARFQAISIEDFRQDPTTIYKNNEELIKSVDKVLAYDKAAQRKMRERFNAGFVKDLRSINDENAQFLLGIYERGQAGAKDDEVTVNEGSAPSKSSNGVGSGTLVGKWTRSTGAGGSRDWTGKTNYNNGVNTSFHFYADGTMQFTVDSQTLSITQCRISEVTKIPGTYSISGGEVTMNLGAGTSVGTSTCESAGNFKKSLSASTLKKSFVVKKMDSVFRPDKPLLLCLDGETKDEACFERDPKF